MFYERLIKLCDGKGIKPTPLIKSMSMSEGNLGKWRNGALPNGETLLKFAEYFGVSTDYLLTGKECKENEKESIQMGIRRFAALEPYEKIKALRKERGMKATDVAQAIEMVELWQYKEFEKGVRGTENSLDMLERVICKYFSSADESDLTCRAEKPFLEEDEYDKTPLSRKIIGARGSFHWDQKTLADALDVEEISVISWESGERQPNELCLQKLCEIFSWNMNDAKELKSKKA